MLTKGLAPDPKCKLMAGSGYNLRVFLLVLVFCSLMSYLFF